MVNFLHKSVRNIFLLILTFVVRIQESLANALVARNAPESLSSVPENGQIKDQFGNPRADAHFRMKAGLLSIFVCAGSIHYQWAVPQEGENQQNLVDAYRMDVVMQNANTSVLPEALEGTGFYENYYTARLQG